MESQIDAFTDPIWKKFEMANKTDAVEDPMWLWKEVAMESPSNRVTEFLTAYSNYRRLLMGYCPDEDPIDPFKVPCLSSYSQGPNISDDEFYKRLGVSYLFHPCDARLICHYLIRKIKNEWMRRSKIKIVANIYDLNPEKLAADYGLNPEKQWLFFTPRDRKYENEIIPNRVALDAYWKVTGADEAIQWNGEICGFRKTLQFYNGSGNDTSWIMHELRVNNPPPQQQGAADDTKLDDWVVCRIYDSEDPWIDPLDEMLNKSSCRRGRKRKDSGRKKSFNGLRKKTSVDEGKHVDKKTSVKVEERGKRVSSRTGSTTQ
ncbi:NAC domain-containing protein [Forsythia ovata]|uniref:NAC domain-containing protein n=1 Tax=Forsythia ovata TaxID=205694 RepID=A0ABD1W883_9LAMI